MLPVMASRLRPSYTLYTAAAVALALGSTLWSFSRLALTLFPFFILIGTWQMDATDASKESEGICKAALHDQAVDLS